MTWPFPELDLAAEAGEGHGGGGRVGGGVVGQRAHGLIGIFGVVLRDGWSADVRRSVREDRRAVTELHVERERAGGGCA